MNDLREQAPPRWGDMVSGGLATALSRIVKQLSQLVVFIFGARILGPTEFGVFALVSVFALMAAQLAQAGSGGFILSLRGSHAELRQVLTIAALLSITALGCGLALAPWIGAWLAMPGLTDLVAMFALWVALATYSDAQVAILIRNGKLVSSAACEAAAECVGMLVALWLLRGGFGAAALVWGRVAAQAIQFVACSAITRSFPTVDVTSGLARDWAQFSRHVLSTRLLFHARHSLTTMMVGGLLGASAVGLLRGAHRLCGAVFELVTEPVRAIAWVFLRHALSGQEDVGSPAAQVKLQRAMEWLMPILAAIAAPVFIGLALLSNEIVGIVLGQAWQEAVPLVAILAIAMLLLTSSTFSEPLLALTGRISYFPAITLFNTAATLVLMLPACFAGVLTVAWAQLAAALVGFMSSIWLHQHVVGLDWRRIAAQSAFVFWPLLLMAAVAMVLRDRFSIHLPSPVIAIGMTVVASAIAYIGTLLLIRRDLARTVIAACTRGRTAETNETAEPKART